MAKFLSGSPDHGQYLSGSPGSYFHHLTSGNVLFSLWAIGYRLLISLFGFDTQHRIVRLMGNYATRQEFLAAILIGVYIFIMVILRLNVLLALVVNTLSNIYVSLYLCVQLSPEIGPEKTSLVIKNWKTCNNRAKMFISYKNYNKKAIS